MSLSGLNFSIEENSAFWTYMFKTCTVRLGPLEHYRNRKLHLEEIKHDVETGAYAPRRLYGFLSSSKSKGVARFVPVFHYRDLAVYYACVRVFEQQLVDRALPGTFGNFTMDGVPRQIEELKNRAEHERGEDTPFSEASGRISEDEEWQDDTDTLPNVADGSPYPFYRSYNPKGWLEDWRRYWKLARKTYEESSTNSCFIMFDVANFYCSIDLNSLERMLRRVCSDQTGAIELLRFFLSTWNRELNKYATSSKGIPMDVTGDCSRLLASAFLWDFDIQMREATDEVCGSYMRFADDMIVACSNERQAIDLIFRASELLHQQALHLNTGKVKILNRAEFGLHWGFDIMEAFESNERLEEGLCTLRQRWLNKAYGRRTTALKRAMGRLVSRPDLADWRKWVLETAFDDNDLVVSLEDRSFKYLISISDFKPETLLRIGQTVGNMPFTEPRARLLRCVESLAADKDKKMRLARKTVLLDPMYTKDSVLKIAVRHSNERLL